MENNKPAIVTFQMKHNEFLFLGKEYSLANPNFKEIWDDFLGTGSKQAVTDFITYCKENKISYPWGASNNWYLKFKGKRIGYLRLRITGMNTGRVDVKRMLGFSVFLSM